MKKYHFIILLLLISKCYQLSAQVYDTGDKVGIGNPSPDMKLGVYSSESWISRFHSNSTDLMSGIRIGRSGGSGGSYADLVVLQDGFGIGPGYSGSNLPLNTQDVNQLALFMQYSSKNVGIGTTSPLEKLDISSVGMRVGSRDYNLPTQAYINIYEGGSAHGARLFLNGSANTFTIKTRLNSVDTDVVTIPYAGANAGNVGIGTADPQSKLSVEGNIRAKEVKIMSDITVPDYVFEEGYKLITLEETKAYIQTNKHLPDIPSAAEIGEHGFDLGDMDMRLLKKIEELTLYQIQLMEKVDNLQEEIELLKSNQ